MPVKLKVSRRDVCSAFSKAEWYRDGDHSWSLSGCLVEAGQSAQEPRGKRSGSPRRMGAQTGEDKSSDEIQGVFQRGNPPSRVYIPL